jgi:hypothetical protein
VPIVNPGVINDGSSSGGTTPPANITGTSGGPDAVPQPDYIILFTGERLAGVVLVLNEQQMILQTPTFGNVHIPVSQIATMQIRTPESAVDRTLYPTPREVASESPLAAGAMPRGGRTFSIELGDPVPPEGFAATGPLNPLNGRLIVPTQMELIGAAGGPAPTLFLSVRHGFDAVVRRVEGELEAISADGTVAPVSRPGFQYPVGTSWRLTSGIAGLLVTGNTAVTFRALGSAPVEARLDAASHGGADSPASVAITSGDGSYTFEHTAASDVTLSLPEYTIAGRIGRMGVSFTSSNGLRVVVLAGTATVTPAGGGASATVEAGQRLDIDPVGTQLRIAATEAMLNDFR